jgi:hypothetical protein
VVDIVKVRRSLQNAPFLLSILLIGVLVLLAAASRLRFGYPFRNLFQPTCIYIPDEEVLPTLIVFLIAAGSATVSFALMMRRSSAPRRFIVGVVVASLAFCVGLLIHGAR